MIMRQESKNERRASGSRKRGSIREQTAGGGLHQTALCYKVRKVHIKNTSWTSVNRSAMTTLSTYNTWIQESRLQYIHHSIRKNYD